MNKGLVGEVFRMALDTLRTNKMRSALTILGVVIGITSIVGMTSLVRGFDESLRDSIRQLGPNTIVLSKLSIVSISGGADFNDLMRRPNLTIDDAKAIERLSPSVERVDVRIGQGPGGVQERAFYRSERTRPLAVIGASEEFANVSFVKLAFGRFIAQPEVLHRRRVAVLGDTAYQALFAKSGTDPVNKKIRIGAVEYTVLGVLEKTSSMGAIDTGQDDFIVIPQTTHQVVFGTDATRPLRDGRQMGAAIMIVPREASSRDQALLEVDEITMSARNTACVNWS